MMAAVIPAWSPVRGLVGVWPGGVGRGGRERACCGGEIILRHEWSPCILAPDTICCLTMQGSHLARP